jgi:septal ring factor EnvC (AmiA/AmiB activator)
LTKDRRLPNVTAETERQAAEKRERRAAALRANLSRRKAQTRERSGDVPGKPSDKD